MKPSERLQVAERPDDGSRGLQPTVGCHKDRRRGATGEQTRSCHAGFKHRSATHPGPFEHRGLKPTATVKASLREDGSFAHSLSFVGADVRRLIISPEKIRASSRRLLQFPWRSLCAAWAVLLQLVCCCCGADLTLKVADKEPPKELDPSIRAKLQSKAVQVMNGEKTAYEFWLSSEVPLQSKPASVPKSLDAIKEATLLGAVSVPATRRDYRDDELAAGVYTMRFALQPQDGDHLGTAEYSYFAVLVSAKIDTKPDGITEFKALVKASAKTASGDHPVILSLRPAPSDDGDPPKLNDPTPEHKSVRVKVPAKLSDEKTSLTFEIVCEGKGKK